MDYLALKMKDIESPEDVSFLVDVFYKKILEDETLSPFFEHIDFEKHKPRMEHFGILCFSTKVVIPLMWLMSTPQ